MENVLLVLILDVSLVIPRMQAIAIHATQITTLPPRHVLDVVMVFMLLLDQVPQLLVSVVSTTTVKLVALVTPLENVPLASTPSMFLEVLACLAEMTTVMLALELELENAQPALKVFTC